MADFSFSAPSFSLGFDDDPPPPSFSLGLDLGSAFAADSDDDSPPPPPSFSLGLDLGSAFAADSDDDPSPLPSAAPPPPNPAGVNDLEDSDEDPCTAALDPDPAPPPALKRLRRGAGKTAAGSGEVNRGDVEFVNVDDEIEEFSSQEERQEQGECTSFRSHVSCSNSKLSLSSCGLLSSQQAKVAKDLKIPPSNASSSVNIGTGSSDKLFPKLTISPIRKFCLVDSDSDDPSSSKNISKDTKNANAPLKMGQTTSSQFATRKEEKAAFLYKDVQSESFWKDSLLKNDASLETPILDEFCDEYYKSARDTKMNHHKEKDTSFVRSRVLNPNDNLDEFQEFNQEKSTTLKSGHCWNSPQPQPPAYQYFYHDDARIQALMRRQFCYFTPIGAEKHQGNHHSTTETLDYMGQFGSRQAPTQARGTPKSAADNLDYMSRSATTHVSTPVNSIREQGEGSSRKRGRRPKANTAKQSSPSNEGWVNPKSNITVPKDVGKRRISADVNKSGHWFTGPDGRKVYVTKNGQELTGRAAYSNYKKDNGGFKKSRKKAGVGKRKR